MEAEEYVKCPECEGLGYNDFGKECRRCSGRGYLVMSCSQTYSGGQGGGQAQAVGFQRGHRVGAIIGCVIGTGAVVTRGAHTAEWRGTGRTGQLFVPVDDTGAA